MTFHLPFQADFDIDQTDMGKHLLEFTHILLSSHQDLARERVALIEQEAPAAGTDLDQTLTCETEGCAEGGHVRPASRDRH